MYYKGFFSIKLLISDSLPKNAPTEIICLSQKEMLYPRKLLRHNSRKLPIFTDQTAALSVKGGLGGRKKGAPTRMEKPGIPMSPLLFKRFWLD